MAGDADYRRETRTGRLWCSALIGWPDDDPEKRAASKQWCGAFVAEPGPFHVTTYLNNAMPESESEMRGVFPEETLKRLQALKKKHGKSTLRWNSRSSRRLDCTRFR